MERALAGLDTDGQLAPGKLKTFGDLIDLHISDMKEVGKAPGRSKDATLRMLKRELGSLNMVEIDRERVVKFGRKRAAQGAGPVTISMDVGAIKLVIQHAAAVHGIPVRVGRVAPSSSQTPRAVRHPPPRHTPKPARSSSEPWRGG